MHTELTQQQIQSYRERGFLVVPEFLDASELAELATAVDQAVTAMGKKKVSVGQDWEEGDGYYDKVFTQRLNLWKIQETVKRYVLNPALGKMLCALAGVEGIRVWHDQALIKEPFANPTAWHLDDPYWSFSSRDAISIWIALDDATYQNGCLYFMPGSHRIARWDNAGIGEDLGALFRLYPEMLQSDPVEAPMRAGSASFHNGLTAHGAGANMTARRRRAMTCAYMPDGSVFNGQQNILPEAYFKSLALGDLLNNEKHNPLVYSAQSS
ncbi:MAG TPA: phytanoyl-CoA dioxygenase family protein [Polyangiaceae bacterium]|jgi:ectoine hydroxylase-related dioxygenase (phytanoyl-CoA dioxygenase family)